MTGPGRFISGWRLAISTFTIMPVRATRTPAGVESAPITRSVAGLAMSVAPAVGLTLGVAVGGLAIGLRALSSPSLVTGLVSVSTLAGLSRGLHLDGLADTADGLGSYQPRARALEIMKSPEIGPFGVVAIVMALAIPAASIGGLLSRPWWSVLIAVAVAVACGRTAVTWACRPGVPAASPTGLGALVAGTVGTPALVISVIAIAALAVGAVPGRPWQGPIAVLAGLAATVLLVRHVTRRLGGITGDVLGACVELATAVTFVGLVLGG